MNLLDNIDEDINKLTNDVSLLTLEKPISHVESQNICPDKQYIINTFNNNVQGKTIDLGNSTHCGSEGHWLERKMGIEPNSKNEPDIRGYEMKKESKKTTLGDFSASEYLFSNKKIYINNDIKISRDQFIKFFGTPNPKKNNRYSWSGECVPKYNKLNNCGQILLISENNDVYITYSFSKDKRDTKYEFPDFMKNDDITIAIWKEHNLKNKINNKFNKKGFFICKKKDGVYDKICFGKPFNFKYFIQGIKNKKIIFDSGMYRGNTRNYSQFRGTSFWNELIIEEY